MIKNTLELKLAQELLELWDKYKKENMDEQAPYRVACEQLGIDPDYGYQLLSLLEEI